MRAYLGVAIVASFAASTPFLLQGCSGDDTSSPPADGGKPDGTVVIGKTDGGSTPTRDGSTSPIIDGGAPISAEVACAASAKARCDALDMCSNGVQTVQRFGSDAVCQARMTAQCLLNLDAGGTGASPATVAACASTIPTETCLQVEGNVLPDECVPVMGTVANGSPCFAAAQCVSSYCAIGATAACGQCAPVPVAGDSCTTTAQCGARAGLVCASGVCVAYADAGAACDPVTAPCPPAYACTTPAADAGTDAGASCQAQGTTVGAACQGASIGAPACDATYGLVCDKGQCVAFAFADAGEPCGNDLDGGQVRCAASGTCVVVDAGAPAVRNGSCIAAATEGQACDSVNGPACLPQAKCVSADGGTAGTCVDLSSATCP